MQISKINLSGKHLLRNFFSIHLKAYRNLVKIWAIISDVFVSRVRFSWAANVRRVVCVQMWANIGHTNRARQTRMFGHIGINLAATKRGTIKTLHSSFVRKHEQENSVRAQLHSFIRYYLKAQVTTAVYYLDKRCSNQDTLSIDVVY